MLRLELAESIKPNERWAMDFMSDGLWNGRKFKALTILDIFTKECLAIEVDTPVNGNRVTRVLDWLVLLRGCPEVITTDNGPEFAGIVLDRWAYNNNVRLDFIKPGKPIQNAFIESFNGRLRHECLNQHYFVTLEEAKKIIEGWKYVQAARLIKRPDTGRIQEGLGRTKTTKRTRNSTYELYSVRGKAIAFLLAIGI